MRLVGASNRVIQLPFILEILVSALVGAGLAVGDPGGVHASSRSSAGRPARGDVIRNWVGRSDAAFGLPVMFLVGLGIAGLSSFRTQRRIPQSRDGRVG